MRIETADKPLWFISEEENPRFGKIEENSIFELEGTVLTFKSEEIWKKHLDSKGLKEFNIEVPEFITDEEVINPRFQFLYEEPKK